MANSTSHPEDEGLLIRAIDDADGIDFVTAHVSAGEVLLNRVEVATTGSGVAMRITLVLDEQEMDKLTTWWHNRRLHEQAGGGYAGAP